MLFSFLCVHGVVEAQRVLAEDLAKHENVQSAISLLNAQPWTLTR